MNGARSASHEAGAVAIVGMACRFPGGASTPALYWDALLAGRDAYAEIPRDRFDIDALYDPDASAAGRIYTRRGAFIELPVSFDADFFGISPREARRLDPQQRLLLELAWEAFEDAGIPPETLARSGAGVFAGISSQDYAGREYGHGALPGIDQHTATGMAMSVAANRISYLLDLRGPSLAVDTACSSALTAVHLACSSIEAGECEVAIAAGVQVLLAPEIWVAFCRAGLLSPDGRSRPFDRDANGFGRGEGAGCVVLRPLHQALAEGDRIHAVIHATGVNQDGRTAGISVPNGDAQETLIRETLAAAGVTPGEVGYVEAHGTGTVVGDRVEALALGRVMAAGRAPGERCAVGSVKGNIGHLEAAAGIAGLIKAALIVRHGVIPPTANHTVPSPAIPWDDLGLRIPTAPETWPQTPGRRFAGVSAFGFGGANAHVLLAEAPAQVPAVADDGRPRVALLSARSPAALEALAGTWADRLAREDAPSLRDVCHTAAVRRSRHRHRLAVVARTTTELSALLAGGPATPGVAAGTAAVTGPGQLAFVFSGMGPQRSGMGMELFETEPVFRGVLLECERRLHELAGWSLVAELSGDGSNGRLGSADRAQAASVALQIALAALWRSWGIQPDVILGHSAGEIAAACVSGGLSLPDALLVAHQRGRLQQRHAGTGGMLAVALGADEAGDLIGDQAHAVSLAAINAPASVTLSGTQEALSVLVARCEERGVFCRPVPVDIPYHSPALDGLRPDLLDALNAVLPRATSVPVVSAVTGDWLDPAGFAAEYWWRNLREPVRFADAVERLLAGRVTCLLELGAHPVLASSLRECAAAAGATSTHVLASLRRGEAERETMLRSLAALHVRGWPADWESANESGRPVDLPTYPWQRERHWIERPLDGAAEIASAPASAGRTLLGRRLRTAQPIWEVDLRARFFAYLADHVIGDAAILPGAAIVSIGLGVVRSLRGDGALCLEQVEFLRMVALNPETGPLVQCHADAWGPGIEIHAAGDAGEWSLVARARVGVPPTAQPGASLDELRLRCPRELPAEEFYTAAAHGRRLRFGPAFRGLVELWCGSGEALGRVVAPAALELDGEEAHPALLDAAFQTIGAALARPKGSSEARLLPVGIERVILHGRLPAEFWAHATARTDTDELLADVVVFTTAGDVLAELHGLRLRPAGAERTTPGAAWLYREHWQAIAPPPPSARSPLRAADVASIARRALDGDGRLAGLDAYYDHLEAALSTLAGQHAVAALRELDMPAVPNGSGHADPAGDRAGRRWTRVVAMASAIEAGSRPVHAGELLERFPAYEAMIRLVEESGRRLAGTLRGDEDAREWLLTGDWWEVLAAVYAEPPVFAAANAATAEAVAAAAGLAGPLRVLEVGAGTGATTAAVLDRARDALGLYHVTDVSPALVRRLRSRFDGSALAFGELDVERPPAGLARAFDVAIAANVVHGTPDLRATLRELRDLLAPGGLLILQEGIRAPAWLDLVFGQFEGWWRVGDGRDGALAKGETWRRALADAGFDAVTEVGAGPGDGGEPAQTVFLATTPERRVAAGRSPRPSGRRWLVLADRGGLGERVAAGLEGVGDRAVCAFPGDALRRREDGGIELRPISVADWRALLRAERAAGGIEGVVHLWSLDLPADGETSAESLLRAQDATCGSLAALTRALDSRGSIEGIAIVTAGVHLLEGDGGRPALARAPLCGLGRVLRSERPDLRVQLVDLGDAESSDDVEALLLELTTRPWPGREGDIAIRSGRPFVRRIERAPLDADAEEPVAAVSADATFKLEIQTPGSLATLALRRCAARQAGPGEVEVRVRAAALNFKDVLIALGLLRTAPDDVRALGFECAGTVVACGEGVEHVRPGDAVIAIAADAGAFGTSVVTRGELVVPAPRGSTPEAAATLPGPFGTAVLALRHVAHLQRGERVLIHAAAGGVGLAAVQIAHQVGAEVLATASTDEKREYLIRAGVAHVMDSRSLAFVDEVLDLTGGEGVDVVLNSLAGEAIDRGVELLRPYGRFVELGRRDIERNAPLRLRPFLRGLTFSSVSFDTYAADRPAAVGAVLRDVVADVDKGVLEPLPHTVFDLSEAEDAFRLMSQAGHIGRIVLAVDEPVYTVRGAAGHAVRADGTYLVAGGLGGLGLSLANRLVGHGARHIVLAGRSAAPAPEDAPLLDALRATGAEVVIARCDIARSGELRRLLDRIRAAMPPLRGVVQAAMVIEDALLERLSLARLHRVLAPKVAGSWNLHSLTLDDELDFFLLLSSVAADLGNPGQANYAAANAFLDALAADRRAQGRPALCLGLGAIADVGHVARRPELASGLARVGVEALDSHDVWDVLDHLLAAGSDRRIVASIDWDGWLNGPGATLRGAVPLHGGGSAANDAAEPVRNLAAELLELPVAERRAALERHVTERAARVLDALPERLDPERPLIGFGLDSLMAVEFIAAVHGETGVRIQLNDVLRGLSLRDLSAAVHRQLEPAPA